MKNLQHYKAIARQQKLMEYMKFRLNAVHNHCIKFWTKFAVAVTFMNPIIFDTLGYRKDEEIAVRMKFGMKAGIFFKTGVN